MSGAPPKSPSTLLTPRTNNYGVLTTTSATALPSSSSTTTTSTTAMIVNGGGPTTTNNNNGKITKNNNHGELKVVILSAYDLVTREPPSCVTIEVCQQIVQTGPPIQRHKDRNSFKFGIINNNNSINSINSTNTNNEVTIKAPLPDLYSSIVKIRLVYNNHMEYTHITDYSLNQLNIGEPMWLILRLEKDPDAATTSLTSTTTANIPNSSLSYLDDMSTRSGRSSITGDDHWDVPPTIRLQMTLNGPYRSEIAIIVQIISLWFHFIDSMEDQLNVIFHSIPHTLIIGPFHKISSFINMKLILVLLVPIIAIVLVASPIIVGIGVVTLPIVLPIVSVLLIIGSIISILLFIIYCSTSNGRNQINDIILKPIRVSFLSYKTGQRLIYQTGVRPSPVHVARTVLPKYNEIWKRLFVSLSIDFIGSLSYVVPILGEFTDIGWAPIQTILIMALYDTIDTKTAITDSINQLQKDHIQDKFTIADSFKYISFIEEILPFTDIIPTATMGWFYQYGIPVVKGMLTKNNNNNINKTK